MRTPKTTSRPLLAQLLAISIAMAATPLAALADNGGTASTTQNMKRTTGTVASDAATTARVKTALLKDPDVAGLKINVDTRDGIVTLSGGVASDAQGIKALQVASKVDGVVKVVNQLQVDG